jgi:hypothetical protein
VRHDPWLARRRAAESNGTWANLQGDRDRSDRRGDPVRIDPN